MHRAQPAAARLWLAVVTVALLLAAPAAAREFKVRYLSADFVYLDAGTVDGLAPGDTLLVSRRGERVATLAVAHAAEHSASCRVLAASTAVQPGDAVRPLRDGPVPVAAVNAPSPRAPAPTVEPTPIPEPSGPPWARTSGYVALQWYRFADRGASGLDYDQPTLRLNFRARKLWGKDLTFQMRGRARHDGRSRRYNETIPADEWSNRVYALSLAYDNPDAVVSWQAGRIVSNALAATGPVDGALLEARLSPTLRAGAFGGFLPDWSSTAPRGSLRKYGLFLNAAGGEYGAPRWSAALAGTAEYHGSTVSRQYLFLRNDWQSGRRWSLFQSWEIDLNNGWRRTPGTAAVELSNVYLSAGYRPGGRTALSVSYDNRRSYRTWDNRALPDSLFDAAFRTGLRANLHARLGAGWTGSAGGGWRHRQGEADDTWSWHGSLTRDDFMVGRVRLTAQVAGFSGPWADGFNPSLQLQKAFLAGHLIGLSGGVYLYTSTAGGDRRQNRWARIDGTRYLTTRFFLSGQYERDWGDDVEGDRFLAEAGLNF